MESSGSGRSATDAVDSDTSLVARLPNLAKILRFRLDRRRVGKNDSVDIEQFQ